MSEKKETKVEIQKPEDTTEYLNSSPENAKRLQESVDQLAEPEMILSTEPEYSQKDVVELLHRAEEAAAAQFVAIMQGFQNNMDNFATNIQVQFDLARYSVGCPVSPLTRQFLDSAKQHKEKVEEELNGDSRQD